MFSKQNKKIANNQKTPNKQNKKTEQWHWQQNKTQIQEMYSTLGYMSN